MQKSSKQNSQTQPVPQQTDVRACESLGFFNYFEDITSPVSAGLESLTAPQPGNQPQAQESPKTTIIDKKDGKYHVYFHTGEVSTSWWETNLNAFTQMMMGLAKEDTVYFYQTGNVFLMPHIVQALIVLDQLCLAQKIFVVDHMIETPLFLMVCNSFLIKETGAIAFSSCIPNDARDGEKIFRPHLNRLYNRAVSCGLLTSGEAAAVLNDDAIVFKTAKQLVQTLNPAATAKRDPT